MKKSVVESFALPSCYAVAVYRYFGTSYRSNLQGSNIWRTRAKSSREKLLSLPKREPHNHWAHSLASGLFNIIIIIIILFITFMHGIYNYIPEKKHVSTVYRIEAVLYW